MTITVTIAIDNHRQDSKNETDIFEIAFFILAPLFFEEIIEYITRSMPVSKEHSAINLSLLILELKESSRLRVVSREHPHVSQRALMCHGAQRVTLTHRRNYVRYADSDYVSIIPALLFRGILLIKLIVKKYYHEHECTYSIEDLMSQADSLMYKEKQRKQET